MTDMRTVVRALGEALMPVQVDGGEVAVNTHVLFPSNGIVTLFIGGGPEKCVVSDRGATSRVVEAHGVRVPSVQRWLSGFARPAGLQVTRNQIHSPLVGLNELPSLVMLVANAASQAARYALDTYGFAPTRDLAGEIEDRLVARFGKSQIAKDVELSGQSNRVYHFDFQVGGAAGERLVVDQVNPFPSSINAKAAAHIDISRRQDHRISQAMIYDPALDWSASDLIFLRAAAPTVPIEKMSDVIQATTIN